MKLDLFATRYSAASVNADFNGVTVIGLQDLSLSEELAAEGIYGNGSVSVGAPAGQHKASGSFVLLPEEADNLVQQLGPNFGLVYFPGTISLFEPQGAGIYEIGLSRVKIAKKEFKMGKAGGNEASTVPFEINIYDPISWNGLTIVQVATSVPDLSSFGFSFSF